MIPRRKRFPLFSLILLALFLLWGTSAVVRAAPGDIVVNEIMQNPSAVADDAGEWFELYNPTGADIDINGWTIADNDIDSHVIDNGGPLLVPAGGYLVLGNNTDSATNGGAPVAYSYGSSWFLSNGADEVVLFDDALVEIDRVEYDGGPAFPDPTGASMALYDPTLDNNVGGNWCTASTSYGDGDFGTPGAANDCPPFGAGVVINEIMQNPAAVADGSGEWFELVNTGSADVDINGWTIADNDSDSHVIANGGPLVLPAGGYLVLGINADSGTNGGVTVDYVYSSFILANGADEVVLFDGSMTEIDRVEYDGGPLFPDPNGAAMALLDPGLDNNDGANWCTAVTPYGDGDLGTPGTANDCPIGGAGVVINEIMQNPAAVADGSGEWFELVNTGSADVDINGWTIKDADFDSHLIDNGGPLVVPAGGYLVLGNNTDTATNGGVPVAYSYGSSWFLANGADEVILVDPAGVEIDSVYYDGGPVFPDPNGASMSLEDPALDNNDGANWCESVTAFGDGDLGTPGEANICTLPPTPLTIMEIQGAAQQSPYDGVKVVTEGVVTVATYNSFYMQDAAGDGDVATSDAILVYTGSNPGVAVGDHVSVVGNVDEYYPGGIGTGNLSTTELGNVTVTVLSSGNPLPAPTVVGNGGRVPPAMVIDDDGNTTFDPTTDGLDFYESMEAMLVQVNDALVVGNNRFGEIAVVGDGGANATTLSARDALVISPGDFNPERIIIDDGLVGDEPDVNVGDMFSAPVIGVFNYDFGNFKLLNFESLPPIVSGGLEREATALTGVGTELTVATFNVENLGPEDADAKFEALADQIVHHLNAPAIIGLQEILDNSGVTNDGVVDASDTYMALIDAIALAGGPAYDFRDIAPLDLQDGGVPGGNIRVGFLFRPDRVTFVDRPGADATTANAVVDGGDGPELLYSPGRIDPTNDAFFDSRKPLAAEFTFGGHTLFVVVNHFNSKGGDDPLFGANQPPVFGSEVQRKQQAEVVNAFVDDILAVDPSADVVVMGDLNDFQFADPILALADDVLNNLHETLPANERYTYIYDGNAEVLDHILLSDNPMATTFTGFDVVHTNAEFDTDFRYTDHDPSVAQLTYPFAFNEDGCYVIALEGSPFTGAASIVHIGDKGYNAGRFGAMAWANANGISKSACFEIHGTDGKDIITAGLNNDVIFGYDGNDLLVGQAGHDTFTAGAGSDHVVGNAGIDTILDFEPDIDKCSNVEFGC